MNRRGFLLGALALAVAASFVFARPAFADPNLGFVQQYTPDNPDGSWNVGSTIHLIANPSNCNSVSVNWGDGTVQTGSGSYIYFNHAYSSSGVYTITARELCSSGGTGSLTITVGSGFGGVNLQTLAGLMGVLFGLLGIGLAASGPSLKVPDTPAESFDGTPTVDLDKKVPILKTDQEVQEQTKFFDGQRKGWELKPGGRAYLDKFQEVAYRVADDPLTKYTMAGSLVKLMQGTADLISPSSVVKYDPDADRYYYDLTETTSREDALRKAADGGLGLAMDRVPSHIFEGLKELEAIPAPPAPPPVSLPQIPMLRQPVGDFTPVNYYNPYHGYPSDFMQKALFGGFVKRPDGVLEWKVLLWGP